MAKEEEDKHTMGETETIDNVINEIGEHVNVVMFLLSTVSVSCAMVGCYSAYMLEFTGFIPAMECTSDNCKELVETFPGPSMYAMLGTICNPENGMVRGTDYSVDTSRSTLSDEFGLMCTTNKLILLVSLYFAGGLAGLALGSFAFEFVGRRKASLFGGVIVTLATFMGTFCNSYGFMVAIRLLQGFGNSMAFAGAYIWVMEFVPARLRVYYSSWSMVIWALGYPGIVFISYFIHNWHYIHLAASLIFVCTYIPHVLLPDSPRYLLSVGKVEEAKKVLESYSRLANHPLDLSGTTLVSVNHKALTEKLSFLQQIKMFCKQKAMLLETVVLLWGWASLSLTFYGLNFGWKKFGDSAYANYLYVALGEIVAYISLIPIVMFLGRRTGMIFTLFGAFTCFILGMIDWTWSSVWTFERFLSLLALVMISCAFGLVFLYTGELAPTTHRGMIMAICSFVLGSAGFMGPFLNDISDDRRVRLGLNAFFVGSSALLFFLLPETQKLPMPEYAADVTVRRHKQDLYNITSILSLRTKHVVGDLATNADPETSYGATKKT